MLGEQNKGFDGMSDNPYESPLTTDASRRTRGIRWAIWSGIACLIVAATCAVLTIVWMIFSFQTISQSSSTPKAKDLAEGISNAMIPAYAIVPFGLVGIILVIVGLVVRRPIED